VLCATQNPGWRQKTLISKLPVRWDEKALTEKLITYNISSLTHNCSKDGVADVTRVTREGRLREEYEQQFPTPTLAHPLIKSGELIKDDSIGIFICTIVWRRTSRPKKMASIDD
jgi:hypothetical protein